MNNIFVYKDGQQIGPFTLEQIRHELKIGSFLPNDNAWYEGLADWVPIQSLLTPPPPVQTASTIQQRKRSLVPLFIVLIVILLIFSGGYFAYESGVFGPTAKQEERDNYRQSMLSLTGRMSGNLKTCHLIVNGVIEVYNAGGEDSFRSYIDATKAPDSGTYNRLLKEDEEISERLGRMPNPPKGLEKMSSELDELHDIYREIMTGVFNPSGTAKEYVGEYESDCEDYYSQETRLYAMMPELKN